MKRLYVLWFSLTFVAAFVVLSRLLLAHSPILDLGNKQSCNAAETTRKARSQSGISFTLRKGEGDSVSCPDPYLLSQIRTGTSESWSTFRKALERYKIFHKQKLKKLNESSNDKTKVRTLTWACSQSKCSGMGDQLFRIQFFLLLAIMSDRVFTVHWDEGLLRSAKYLLPNEIDWSYFNQSKGMCTDDESVMSTPRCSKTTFDATSIWGFGWNKKEFNSFGDAIFGPEEHVTVTGRVIAQGVMFVGKDSILDPGYEIRAGFERLGITDILGREVFSFNDSVQCGHKSPWYHLLRKFGVHHVMEIPEMNNGKVIATEPWLQVSHVLLCYLFKFPKILVNEVNKLTTSMGLHEKRYLAVHLRTGFKGMPHEESFATRWYFRNYKMFDETYIWDGILAYSFDLATKMIGPDSIVYLSTDTDVAKKRFQRKYGHRLKVSNLTEIHPIYSRSKCEGESSSTENNKKSLPSVYSDPYVSMWIDFFLLGRADVMVHGDSAFSENACFLRPISHLNHVWFMHDYSKNCIASYIGSNSTCIVQYR